MKTAESAPSWIRNYRENTCRATQISCIFRPFCPTEGRCASGYPPDPMSFRCRVGTCTDGVRRAWSHDSDLPSIALGSAERESHWVGRDRPSRKQASLRSQRVLIESKADARGPHKVGKLIGDFQRGRTEKRPLVGERLPSFHSECNSSPPRGGARGSVIDCIDGAKPGNPGPHLYPDP